MRKLLFIFLLITNFALLGKEISIENTVEKNGIIYEKNSDIPFSGVIRDKTSYKNAYTVTTYKNGKKNGNYKKKSTVDRFMETGTYINGELECLYTREYEGMSFIVDTTEYKNGIKNGEYKAYSQSGLLHQSGTYVNDVLEGEFHHYDSYGEKSDTKIYKNGNIINDPLLYAKYGLYDDKFLIRDSYGNPQEHTIYLNDKKHGLSTQFYSTGEVESHTNYVNGKKEGAFSSYYKRKTFKEKGEYLNDQKNGEWTEYKSNKSIVAYYTYVNGILDGMFETYHQPDKSEFNSNLYFEELFKNHYLTGKPSTTGTYTNGYLDGIYIEYDYLGNTLEYSIRSAIKNGEIVEDSTKYSENLELSQTISFKSIGSNNFRIDYIAQRIPQKTFYLINENSIGKRISPITYSLTEKYRSEVFLFIEKNMYILIIPYIIFMLIIFLLYNKLLQYWNSNSLFSNQNSSDNIFETLYFMACDIIIIKNNFNFKEQEFLIPSELKLNIKATISEILINSLLETKENYLSEIEENINENRLSKAILNYTMANNHYFSKYSKTIVFNIIVAFTILYFGIIIGIYSTLIISLSCIILFILIIALPIYKILKYRNSIKIPEKINNYILKKIVLICKLSINKKNELCNVVHGNFYGKMSLLDESGNLIKEFNYIDGLLSNNQNKSENQMPIEKESLLNFIDKKMYFSLLIISCCTIITGFLIFSIFYFHKMPPAFFNSNYP
ncbi:toxin-antitoxin system YwqK family antitoxin [Fusobacterium sp. PH5-44]|uniref:toxin-antitoxin system YwqK family antitoxin n=1 Tax=unclassified Fusobacterium TaxID=2648384 RepID=UPI003D1E3D9B